jgi:hypothetical protein
VKSPWIVNKLIDKFKAQHNMPIKAFLVEIKDQWGVDVKKGQVYRARRIAKYKILEKMKLQYKMI